MIYTRRSVWANGGDLDDPLLFWYAKGVGLMQTRPLTDPTSWRFMAAVHGIDTPLWTQYGYLKAGEALPSERVQERLWKQCQHRSWYFLPWHRGYISSIEVMLCAAIISLGGPSDWAMPYWNYSSKTERNARQLPPAFAAERLPDGSPNPLHVVQRYGNGRTPITIPESDVSLSALTQSAFTGSPTGGSPGFGGVVTAFSHRGERAGALESMPHNVLHGDIGGGIPRWARAYVVPADRWPRPHFLAAPQQHRSALVRLAGARSKPQKPDRP